MSADMVSHLQAFAILLAIGAGGGFLSGLLGVGGGIVFVPALYFSLKHFGLGGPHVMHISIGTSMAIILVTAASSAFWHHKRGSVDFSILKSWWPFVVLGVVVGTYFASSVNGHLLKQIFASTALLTAVYMIYSKERQETEQRGHRVSKGVQRIVAAFIAMVSALIGVGGAMMNIPFMAYIGMPMRKCVGTGGVLGFMISLPAMIGYIVTGLPHMKELPPYSFGYVNLAAVAAIIPVCLIMSPVGVHFSHNTPRELLRRIFAVVLVIVGLRMLITH